MLYLGGLRKCRVEVPYSHQRLGADRGTNRIHGGIGKNKQEMGITRFDDT